jgi:hypothetical protein
VVVSSTGPGVFHPAWLKSFGVLSRLAMFYLCFKVFSSVILQKLSEIWWGEKNIMYSTE